jgi:hypothetical protein
MKKNNSADFTQFELFDETVTVFEIVENAIKEQVQEQPKTENKVELKKQFPNIIICGIKR